MITLRNVTKTYRSGETFVHALKGIDLKIESGDFFIIRGPSGSGKSTLLNIIGLLDDPSSGEVLLNSELVHYEDFDKLATTRSKFLSFIFQSFNLNPVLTVEENVMVPLMIRGDIPREERSRRVEEWLGNTGLISHRHHKPDQISGGQRQRVAIARAMVTHPSLVIADEPTANLDSATSKSILALMRKLNEENKVAFLFATHDPIFEQFAKKTVHIVDGKLG